MKGPCNPPVSDDELTVLVGPVLAPARSGNWTLHRIQDGYDDGVPRAVFVDPGADEPIGVPLTQGAALLLALAARLAKAELERRKAPSAQSPPVMTPKEEYAEAMAMAMAAVCKQGELAFRVGRPADAERCGAFAKEASVSLFLLKKESGPHG